jgi:hypothetical protein
MAQVVEHLPSKCEVLSSNPSTVKKKKTPCCPITPPSNRTETHWDFSDSSFPFFFRPGFTIIPGCPQTADLPPPLILPPCAALSHLFLSFFFSSSFLLPPYSAPPLFSSLLPCFYWGLNLTSYIC